MNEPSTIDLANNEGILRELAFGGLLTRASQARPVGAGAAIMAAGAFPAVLQLVLSDGAGDEIMSDAVVDAALSFVAASDVPAIDLVASHPEQHPRFAEIVILARALRRRVIYRCGLGGCWGDDDDTPEFLALHGVQVIGALPVAAHPELCIRAASARLARLTDAGYGTDARLGLVLLTTGDEVTWRGTLEDNGLSFGRLQLVSDLATARGGGALACRYTLAVGGDGTLYDRGGEPPRDRALPMRITEATSVSLAQRPLLGLRAAHTASCLSCPRSCR